MKYSVKLSTDSLGAELGARLQTKQILEEVRYKWNKIKEAINMGYSKSIHFQHNHKYLQNKQYFTQHFGPCKMIQEMLQHALA